MFEDFSFSSPSSSRPPRLALDDDRLMTDSDSLISPMSSRCPSPRSFSAPRFPRSRSLYFRSPQQQPPTSVPFSAYDHHRLSIGTLTKKLHEHTIQNPSGGHTSRAASPSSTPRSPYSSRFPGYVLTPPDTDHDDEGYGSPVSPSLSPQPQSPFLNPTSAPLDLQSDLQMHSDLSADPNSSVRTRRQHISRLQVQYTSSDLDVIRRTLLAAADDDVRKFDPLLTEACHPSSLPPTQSRRRRTVSLQRSRVRSPVSPDAGPGPGPSSGSGSGDTQSRRKSVSGTGALAAHSNRIEKNYQSSSNRDRKKSEAGLRRKSVVSAALASMIENEE
ncbi:hypothetical protein BDW59DRAFT_176291 [Aspergillus cavernicola]|uniref:Uncharacterized protein n=1 Tax=Aspergillus cavernicola TaxID=176166 RepID=A0ABR4HHD8_9EURO